jgi:hypothetical protein
MNSAAEMGVWCHDINTKFHRDWFRHSEVNMGGYTYRHTERQECDVISVLN